MKFIIRNALILLMLLSMAAGMCGCSDVVKSKVKNDATEWALSTGDTEMTVALVDGKPYITHLALKGGGDEYVSQASEIYIPDRYRSYTVTGLQYFNWAFTGYSTEKNKKTGVNALYLYFKDTEKSASYVLTCKSGAYNGPFEIAGAFTPNGSDVVRLMPEEIFSLNVTTAEAPTAWQFHEEGGPADNTATCNYQIIPGEGIYKTVLETGTKKILQVSSKADWYDNDFIPMVYLDTGAGGVYAALEWPDERIDLFGNEPVNGLASSTVAFSFNAVFMTDVNSGESMNIPAVYIGVYSGSVDDGSNVFKHWFFDYKVPAILRETENEPYTQIDAARYGTQEYRFATPEENYANGIESAKWDINWWNQAACNEQGKYSYIFSYDSYNGDFSKLDAILGYSLKDYVAEYRAAGMNFTAYTLLRVAAEGNEVFDDHPDWFLPEGGMFGWEDGLDYGYYPDMTNSDCINFIKVSLSNFFNATGIKGMRSDFDPVGWHGQTPGELFESANGFLEIVDYLYETVDGFRYEDCNGGGCLKDFYAATRAVIINCDDSQDYNSLRTSFYDSSYCFHPTQLHMPFRFNWNALPENTEVYYDFSMRSTIIGAPMTAGGGEEWNPYVSEYYQMYIEKVRPIQREGELYHILPRPDQINWDGIMYADPDSKNEIKGVVFLFKPTDTEGPVKNIVFDGLDAGTMYQLTFEDSPEQNCVKSGAELMSTGINVTIEGDVGSEIIWITEANVK